ICSGASSPASVSANNPPEPCGKQRLNPVNKPGEKALHIQPVHNIGFHPQQFFSFPPAKAQERHSLVQCAKPCISWDTWIYPQNFAAPYINIKTKLYKISLFYFLFT